MRYLKTYENFSTADKEQILSEVNDIFDELRDENLSIDINRGSRKTVKDQISVGIHTKLTGESVVDFTQPSIKLKEISEVIKRANDYLINYSYKMEPMFCIRIEVDGMETGGRDDSDFIEFDKIDDYADKSYSHISIDWVVPFGSYEEMRDNIRR